MKKMKRVFATVLCLALVLSLAQTAGVEAAKKPKLNKKKVNVTVGKTKTVKVKNGVKKAKVTWKTSDKSVAVIAKKSKAGNKAFAKIKGVKAGNAKVTAVYKLGKTKKRLVCKVNVKDNQSNITPATDAPTSVPTAAPTAVPTPTVPPSAEMQAFLDTITIPYMEEVRGHITLPETIDGAEVVWTSSNTDVITDQEVDGKAPGFVTRGAEDQVVKLTAKVTKDGETAYKEIAVNVLKAPEALTEDDFVGYLFGSFTGTERVASDEQIYFAVSEDGYFYKDLNDKQPVLTSTIGECGVRDPYICRSAEGDRFFLIATDLSIYSRGGWGNTRASVDGSHYLIFWESTDLVNWGEARMIEVACENAGMAWAPEMIYNDKTGEYVIFFASSLVDANGNYTKNSAIYCTTTRDFVNFSETELYIDNMDGRDIIDTTMLKVGDYYYRASKDGENGDPNGGIRVDRSDDIFGEWEKVLDLDELGFNRDMTNRTLEGPELFKFNKRDWTDPDTPLYGLFSDRYMEGAGYLPLTTTDFEDTKNARGSWKIPGNGEYSFDALKKRHGTILNITQEELDNLNAAYGK